MTIAYNIRKYNVFINKKVMNIKALYKIIRRMEIHSIHLLCYLKQTKKNKNKNKVFKKFLLLKTFLKY